MPLKQLGGVCQIVCLSSKGFVNKNESPLGKFFFFILQGTGWVSTPRRANRGFYVLKRCFRKIKDLQRYGPFPAPVFFLGRNNFHHWHNLCPSLPRVLPGWYWQNLIQGCLLLSFFFFGQCPPSCWGVSCSTNDAARAPSAHFPVQVWHTEENLALPLLTAVLKPGKTLHKDMCCF